MDIKMPGIDGYTATRAIRQFNPMIPIIAVTAYAQPTDEQAALNAGCNSYLAKPVKKADLLKMVNTHLSN
jgi:CheY-like chemotaxis protein